MSELITAHSIQLFDLRDIDMTTMQDALERALRLSKRSDSGVVQTGPEEFMTTASRRIWLWLKENGPHVPSAIVKGTGITYGTVSSRLFDMRARGMVTTKPDPSSRFRPGAPSKMYTAEGDEYRLLPIVNTKKPKPKPAVWPPLPMDNLPSAPSSPTPLRATGVDLENMTLRELRVLFLRLKQLFPGE